jgi:hypothetical protein
LFRIKTKQKILFPLTPEKKQKGDERNENNTKNGKSGKGKTPASTINNNNNRSGDTHHGRAQITPAYVPTRLLLRINPKKEQKTNPSTI